MNSIKTAGPGPAGRFQLNRRGAQTALRAELFCQVLLAQGQLAPHTREREREQEKEREREGQRDRERNIGKLSTHTRFWLRKLPHAHKAIAEP
jgi:hypothetical protein